MKSYILIFISILCIVSCQTNVPTSASSDTLTFEKNEQEEYDIIVLDSGYNLYLNSIAKPMNFYSEEYYKSKNQVYVAEWNARHMNPSRYDPNFYSLRIDYDSSNVYGILLEYKLYNYFEYIKWKYNIDLNFSR